MMAIFCCRMLSINGKPACMRAHSSLTVELNDIVMMLTILVPITSLEQRGKKLQLLTRLEERQREKFISYELAFVFVYSFHITAVNQTLVNPGTAAVNDNLF